jgi:hypothetical protein
MLSGVQFSEVLLWGVLLWAVLLWGVLFRAVLLRDVLLFDARVLAVAFFDLLAARFGRAEALLTELRLLLLAAAPLFVFAFPVCRARLRLPAFFFVLVLRFFAICHLRLAICHLTAVGMENLSGHIRRIVASQED